MSANGILTNSLGGSGGGGGSGTVTSVSVVSANGLAGTVATATTTPAITLSTSITGLLKGNGTAISAATSGTDYAGATQTFDFCGFIEGPTNKVYTFAYNLDFGGTITATKTICTSGTATATFKIGTTALGGAANSVASGGDSIAQSTNNVFVAGNILSVTVSSNASCIDFQFTVKFTRVMA